MFAAISVGTNNLEKAAEFYDALFAAMGHQRMGGSERGIAWGSPNQPMLSVLKPFDGQPATAGNGSMATFAMASTEQIDKVHQLALSLGGTNEGEPGPRGEEQAYYCAYFRDLDGNKFNLFCMLG